MSSDVVAVVLCLLLLSAPGSPIVMTSYGNIVRPAGAQSRSSEKHVANQVAPGGWGSFAQ